MTCDWNMQDSGSTPDISTNKERVMNNIYVELRAAEGGANRPAMSLIMSQAKPGVTKIMSKVTGKPYLT